MMERGSETAGERTTGVRNKKEQFIMTGEEKVTGRRRRRRKEKG